MVYCCELFKIEEWSLDCVNSLGTDPLSREALHSVKTNHK